MGKPTRDAPPPTARVPSIHLTLLTAEERQRAWSPCLPERPQTDQSQLGGDHVFGPVGCGLGCASDNQTASIPELPRKARPVIIRGQQLRHLKSTTQAFAGGPWRPSWGQARGQGSGRVEIHAAEPASSVVVAGGETFTLEGTIIIFKSLGMKTTIKQLKLRMASEF